MTLATHIVVGAAAAKICTSHPVEAFFVGAASHFLLDAIPHWDYKIDSLSDENAGADPLHKNIRFTGAMLRDAGKVLFDAFLGFAVLAGLIFFSSKHVLGADVALMLAGALGGVMPDFLQFLYGVWKNPLLRMHQTFHNYIHARIKLDDRPLLGVPIQISIVLIVGSILSKFLIQ